MHRRRRSPFEFFWRQPVNMQSRTTATIRLLVATVFLILATGTMAAQLDTGSITGTVTDSSGAAIPGAKITLTNVGTNAHTDTQSTATGTYAFDDLLPGAYTIQSKAQGFQDYLVR